MPSQSFQNFRQRRPLRQVVKDLFSSRRRPETGSSAADNSGQLVFLDPHDRTTFRLYDINCTEKPTKRKWYGRKPPVRGENVKVSLAPAMASTCSLTSTTLTDQDQLVQLDFLDPFDKTNFRRYDIDCTDKPTKRKWYGLKPKVRGENVKVTLAPAIRSVTSLSSSVASENDDPDQLLTQLDFLDPFDKTNFRRYDIACTEKPTKRKWYGFKPKVRGENVKVTLAPAFNSTTTSLSSSTVTFTENGDPDQLSLKKLDFLDPFDKTNFRFYDIQCTDKPLRRKWYGLKPKVHGENVRVCLQPEQTPTDGDQLAQLEILDPFTRQDYRLYDIDCTSKPLRRKWYGKKPKVHGENLKVCLHPAQTADSEEPSQLRIMDPFTRKDYRLYDVNCTPKPLRRKWYGKKPAVRGENVKVCLNPAQTLQW